MNRDAINLRPDDRTGRMHYPGSVTPHCHRAEQSKQRVAKREWSARSGNSAHGEERMRRNFASPSDCGHANPLIKETLSEDSQLRFHPPECADFVSDNRHVELGHHASVAQHAREPVIALLRNRAQMAALRADSPPSCD